jgi:hypothetical protein
VRFLAFIISLSAVSAWADDLPTNLLLKCEGKVKTTSSFEGSRPDFREAKFEKMLRLKDGGLSAPDTPWPTQGCLLHNDIIRCSASETAWDGHPPFSDLKGIERIRDRLTDRNEWGMGGTTMTTTPAQRMRAARARRRPARGPADD